MNVVSHKAIRTFCQKHSDASSSLDRWYRVAKRATWVNFVEVKQTFNTADFVAPYIVFDIGGNKYRLIAEINFSRKVLFVRGVVTHEDLERNLETMSATLTVDRKKYVRLANRIVVKAIENEKEYDRMVAAVEELMDKSEDNLSVEESALLETIAILIQAYDDRNHALPPVPPNEMLAYLMETSGRAAKDLLPVFGTRGRVSEVLNAKRSVSKEQAKKLALLFRVSVDLFL